VQFVLLGVLILVGLVSVVLVSLNRGVFLSPTLEYEQTLSLVTHESIVYDWRPENPGELRSVSLSGSFVGDVEVYLVSPTGEELLILDSANFVVGFSPGGKREKDSKSKPLKEEPPETVEEPVVPEEPTPGAEPTPEPIPEEDPVPEPIPESEPIPEEFVFTNVCVDTCDLSRVNLEGPLALRVAGVGDFKLKIETVSYEVLGEEFVEEELGIEDIPDEAEREFVGTLRGFHGDDFENRRAIWYFYLETEAGTFEIKFPGSENQDIGIRGKVRIFGNKLGEKIILTDGDKIEEIGEEEDSLEIMFSPPDDNPNLGEQKTLVALVNWDNDPFNQPYTVPEVYDFVLDPNDVNSTNVWVQEVSYEKASMAGEVNGWYTLQNDTCDFDIIANRTIFEMDSDVTFIEDEKYRILIFVPDGPGGCSWAFSGVALQVGSFENFSTSEGLIKATVSFINTDDLYSFSGWYRGTVRHELGHNFGVPHAASYDCDDVFEDDCFFLEYGDPHDVMGASSTTMNKHYNADFKERIGWFEDSNIIEVQENGIYVLHSLEESTSSVQSIKIPNIEFSYADSSIDTTDYHLEFRNRIGFDSDESRFPTVLLRASSSTARWNYQRRTLIQANIPFRSLQVGEVYNDTEHEVSIEVLNINEDDGLASVRIITNCENECPNPGEIGGCVGGSIEAHLICGNNDADVCGEWELTECSPVAYCVEGQGCCESQASSECLGGDAWWFDSCGNAEELKEFCGEGTLCEAGDCFQICISDDDCPYATTCNEEGLCVSSCGDGMVNGDGTCTINITSDIGDDRVWRSGNSWEQAREGSSGFGIHNSSTSALSLLNRHRLGGASWIYRLSFPFDTLSALPENAEILSAQLTLSARNRTNSHPNSEDYLTLVQANLADPPVLTIEDYDQFGSLDNPIEGAQRIDASDLSSSYQFVTFTLNENGLSWINTQGWTTLGIRGGYDVENVYFPNVNTSLKVNIHSSSSSTPEKAPTLGVVYGFVCTSGETCSSEGWGCGFVCGESCGVCPEGLGCQNGVCGETCGSCPGGLDYCHDGECVECIDECNDPSESTCFGQVATIGCGNFDEDVCYEWGFTSCDTGETCHDGACYASCEEVNNCETLELACGFHMVCSTLIFCGDCEGEECNPAGQCVPENECPDNCENAELQCGLHNTLHRGMFLQCHTK